MKATICIVFYLHELVAAVSHILQPDEHFGFVLLEKLIRNATDSARKLYHLFVDLLPLGHLLVLALPPLLAQRRCKGSLKKESLQKLHGFQRKSFYLCAPLFLREWQSGLHADERVSHEISSGWPLFRRGFLGNWRITVDLGNGLQSAW